MTFLIGVLLIAVSIGMIIFILTNESWGNIKELYDDFGEVFNVVEMESGNIFAMLIGIIGAIISEIAYRKFGVECGGLVKYFVIAAVLAKIDIIVIPLFLEFYFILSAGLINIVNSMPESVNAAFSNFQDSTWWTILMIVVPFVFIFIKIYVHDD